MCAVIYSQINTHFHSRSRKYDRRDRTATRQEVSRRGTHAVSPLPAPGDREETKRDEWGHKQSTLFTPAGETSNVPDACNTEQRSKSQAAGRAALSCGFHAPLQDIMFCEVLFFPWNFPRQMTEAYPYLQKGHPDVLSR